MRGLAGSFNPRSSALVRAIEHTPDGIFRHDVAGLGLRVEHDHDLSAFELPDEGALLLLQAVLVRPVIGAITGD